jgi:RHS repeat-associated protein
LLGRQIAVIDANNRRNTTQYDALGHVTRIANEMNQPVNYEYDLAGRRTALIDASGNKTVWEYDVDGRQTSMTYPNGDREEYKYDAAGRQIEKKTPNGEFIRFTYDQNTGFLARVDVVGDVPSVRDLYTDLQEEARDAGLEIKPFDFSTRNFSIIYTRDEQGRVLTETCPQTTLRHLYDDRGLLKTVTDTAQNATILYDYDALGLRTKMSFDLPSDPSKNVISPILYSFNAHGRITKIQAGGGIDFEYTHNDLHQTTGIHYPNGILQSYSYRPDGGLQRISLFGKALADKPEAHREILASVIYTTDSAGNITGRDSLTGTAEYVYDPSYRLVSEQRHAIGTHESNASKSDIIYEYDSMGNRTDQILNGVKKEEYSYNNANQLISKKSFDMAGGTAVVRESVYRYDRNGNMIAEIIAPFSSDEANSAITIYFYDALNRLIRIEGTSQVKSFHYTYRGLQWHRFSTYSLSSDNSLPEQKTYFLYDRDDIVIERSDVGATSQYVLAGLDRRLVRIEYPGGQTIYFHSDERNTLLGLSDTGGHYESVGDFSAFGEFFPSDTNPTSRVIFGGRNNLVDDNPSFYDFRHRYYIAGIGRFSGRDPIAYEGNRHGNLYQFVSGNPLNYVDPFGLTEEECKYCGPDVTDVLVDEITRAHNEWTLTFYPMTTSWSSVFRYRAVTRWLDMLNRGPQLDYLAGLYSVNPPLTSVSCPSGEECMRTYEICDVCVHDHFIGNIMYGYWMRLHGFTDTTANTAGHIYQILGLDDLSQWRPFRSFDKPWDQAGYRLARKIHDNGLPTIANICQLIRGADFLAAATTDSPIIHNAVCKKCPYKRDGTKR